jgi:iron(III) transport system permease protein
MQNVQSIPFSVRVRETYQRARFNAPSKLQVLAVAIIALVSLPLPYLLLRALNTDTAVFGESTLRVVWNSVALAGAVVLSAALIGVPFAWLTARTNLPFRRLWLVLGLLPLVIPSYIGTMALIDVFGPRGVVQGWLEPLGVTRLPSIYGFFGAWLALTLFTYPYVVLPVRAALLNMDAALEEAAHSLGLSRWRVFLRVTLPGLRPSLAAGMLLTVLYTLSDFGVVAFMRYDAFTRVIYMQYTNSFDRARAAALALVLVALTIGLLMMERRASAKARNYRIGIGTQRRCRSISLGLLRLPALLFCGVLVTLGVVVPVAVLLKWFSMADSIQPDLIRASLNSLTVSGSAALVIGLAALPLGILATRSATRFNRTLVGFSYIGNVLPGLVIALALVFFAANAIPVLYQTLPILILGYATRFLPISVGATASAFTQINPCLDEAGRSLGLRPTQVVWRITAPLARTGIFAGVALVFLSAMKELPITLLLSPTGYTTLATQVWSSYHQVSFAQIGAPALMIVLVSAISLYFILYQRKTT